MSATLIQGAKAGQEKPHQPSIARDSVASISKIKILYALAEGEIKGLVNGGASILLDGTPLLDENGQSNFENVEWEIRTGTVDQPHIAGMPSLSSEMAINTTVRSGTAWIRTITNTQLSSANVNISWARLSETTDKFDVIGTTVNYAIDVQTDGNGYVTVLDTSIKAKTSGRYQRTHNVKLPEAEQGWQIRVRKVTADGDNERKFNQMQVDSVAEIIDAKLRYPHTALLYLSFDARTFGNMPKVAVDCYLRYLKIPSNYDPETRTSTGLWDGTFKTGYTNNPAWVYYDLITNDRYALGDRLKPFMINKWAIAHIASICDQAVSDGKGGTEPRFQCDVYLQVAEQGYQVLQHIAAIFRGMSFWDGSQIVLDADTPRDVDYVITRANVIDGQFNKSGTSIDDRHTVVQVAYSNPDNNYETDYVMVRNERAIAKYGINVLDMPVVGCTSAGQAYRAGLAALLSEQNRTQTVTFTMGLDGSLPTVGSRVDIADMMFTGLNNGGRISAVNANRTVITVDRDDVPADTGDRLSVNLESGRAQNREIASISGRNITVKAPFDPVAPENVWAVDSDELPTMPFIVLKMTANEERTQYSYTALQYDGTLQSQIDNGTIIEPIPPAPPFNPYIIDAPTAITLDARHQVNQGITVATLIIVWDQVKDAVAYDVEWRKDDGDWIKLPRTGNISAEIDGVYSGNYLARVRAVSAFDAISKPTTSMLTAIVGKAGTPPQLSSLTATGLLFGMQIDWSFSLGSGDTAYTEIQVGSAPDVNVTTLGQFGFNTDTHTINGLQGNLAQSYRGRIVDKLGNVSPWTPWVTATTDASADKVLDLIEGKINGSSLDVALNTKIDKIGTIESDLATETGQRIQDIIDAKQLADAAQTKANSASTAATDAANLAGNKGEVIYQWQTPAAARQLPQNLWIDTTGGKNTPKRWDGSAWVAVTDKAAIDAQAAATEALNKANEASQSIVTILNEQELITDELGLQYETLQGVIADYKPRYTDKNRYTDASRSQQWTYAKTVARDNYATNERITNLQSSVGDSNADFTNQLFTLAQQDKAIVSDITQLKAKTDDNAALIRTESTARSTQYDALSQQINTVQSSTETAQSTAARAQTEAANAATLAGNKGEVIYQWQTPSTARQQSQNLWIDTKGDKNTPKRWNGSAWVAVTDKAAIDAQAAANGAQSTANDALGKANTATTNIATIKTDLKTVTTESSSTASALEILQSTVGNNTSSIQTSDQVVDGLKAQSTTVLDVNGYAVGFGTYNDGTTGTFAINVDEFYLGTPNGLSKTFVHYNTPQTINGVVIPIGTYLDAAYIAKASIDLAQINTASITSLSALSATIGHFKSAQTGARLEIKDSLLSVYDENDTLRVRLGLW